MPKGGVQKTKKKVGTKPIFVEKAKALFLKYRKAMLVTAENVNATQLAKIRRDLEGKAEILFGKNSLMRLVVRQLADVKPELGALEPVLIKGAALIFADGPFTAIREIVQKHCVGSAAKVGAISPVEITIPPQKTTMLPTQVGVLHALNIQSKVFKGTLEITSEKLLVRVGDKVGASEANLLNLLGIMPFKYGLKIVWIYDSGHVYQPEVLDISDDILAARFAAGLAQISALSVAIGFPNEASAHHLISAAFKQIAAVAVAAEIPMQQISDIQALLSDPEALAQAQAAQAAQAAAAVQAGAPAAGAAAAEVAAPVEEKVEEEVHDEPLDFGDLFG